MEQAELPPLTQSYPAHGQGREALGGEYCHVSAEPPGFCMSQLQRRSTNGEEIYDGHESISANRSWNRQQNQIERQTWPMREEQPKHHTSTRIPLECISIFEELAVEHGYRFYSLRIYAMTWFVRGAQGRAHSVERDRSVTSKRVVHAGNRIALNRVLHWWLMYSIRRKSYRPIFLQCKSI